MLHQLWIDEAGLVVSAELILVLTIGVLMLVVGLHAVAKAVNYELGDLGAAFGAIDQTYSYDGFVHCDHACVHGAAYRDEADDCDCREIVGTLPMAHADGSPSNNAESGVGAP